MVTGLSVSCRNVIGGVLTLCLRTLTAYVLSFVILGLFIEVFRNILIFPSRDLSFDLIVSG